MKSTLIANLESIFYTDLVAFTCSQRVLNYHPMYKYHDIFFFSPFLSESCKLFVPYQYLIRQYGSNNNTYRIMLSLYNKGRVHKICHLLKRLPPTSIVSGWDNTESDRGLISTKSMSDIFHFLSCLRKIFSI